MRTRNLTSHKLPMSRPLRLLLFFSLLFFKVVAADAVQISDYRVIREPVTDRSGRTLWAIRSFIQEGVPHRLVVDPATLESYNVPAVSVTAKPASPEEFYRNTRLGRAVRKYTSSPYLLQNDGATRAETRPDGLFLTVDLCPSKRPFERELFEAAAALSQGKPVPVAVMVSGLWLADHPREVAYLKGEVAAGRLAITWVNHSWHHHYDPKAPLAGNFLLAPGTDVVTEVLEPERQFLAQGLVPAPFFRFPGLVSDAAAMERLAELSLIPVGADAWLAKGEEPRPGSFILVHGNGNEPKGIKLALPLLKTKGLRLLPLAAAFVD